MSSIEEIFPRVRRCIVASTGAKEKDVVLGKTLIGDMGVDSIDLIDMIFEMEREFGISLAIGDFERRARKLTGSEPFEIDQKITPAGIRALQEMMPELPKDRFREGLMLPEIPLLFTVETLCSMVRVKLGEKS